jgi:hypothetical protein
LRNFYASAASRGAELLTGSYHVITYQKRFSIGSPLNILQAETVAEVPSQGFSLLRLSALSRLSFALIVSAGMWGIVFWALN